MAGHTVPRTLVRRPRLHGAALGLTGQVPGARARLGSLHASHWPSHQQRPCFPGLCPSFLLRGAASWQWYLRPSPSRTRMHMFAARPASPESRVSRPLGAPSPGQAHRRVPGDQVSGRKKPALRFPMGRLQRGSRSQAPLKTLRN